MFSHIGHDDMHASMARCFPVHTLLEKLNMQQQIDRVNEQQMIRMLNRKPYQLPEECKQKLAKKQSRPGQQDLVQQAQGTAMIPLLGYEWTAFREGRQGTHLEGTHRTVLLSDPSACAAYPRPSQQRAGSPSPAPRTARTPA